MLLDNLDSLWTLSSDSLFASCPAASRLTLTWGDIVSFKAVGCPPLIGLHFLVFGLFASDIWLN